MTTIEQFTTHDALIAQSQANRTALAALNDQIEFILEHADEINELRATLSGAMADMYEAMCTIQEVANQASRIREDGKESTR